jgi:uncharacterized protein YndB with AHSA1/START domain
MDYDAVLAHPIGQVFGHLADPDRLGDWLPAATAIHSGHQAATFTLRLSAGPAHTGAQIGAAGELIGYEPPWQLAYRLRAGPDTHVLRITCTTTGAGTRVHVRQAGPATPLTVDLARLGQALTAGPRPGTPGPAREGNPLPLAPATIGPSIQPRLRRDIMHPIFKELFPGTDIDDLAAAAANRANRPRP